MGTKHKKGVMKAQFSGKLDLRQLRQRQSLPLELKEKYTERRIINWYDHFRGMVYVGFSGGKDSTVLLHQVRKLYPEVPAVFVDTGLEYPEVREFVKTIENVTWIRPKKPFNQIIEEYGFPIVSKKVSGAIYSLQHRTAKNESLCSSYLTGVTASGVMCPSRKISEKWHRLVDAPFPISDKCCHYLKKEPSSRYERETRRLPYLAIMATDSKLREKTYLNYGCNVFQLKRPFSAPMSFWLTADVWAYITQYNVPYSKIYNMGEERTGCMFCMFGVHLDKGGNKFQRMKIHHPAQYKFCIENLGIGKCLDFIGVPY